MTRVKRMAEAARAPRDAVEANLYLGRIGALQRQQRLIQVALDESAAAAKAAAEADAKPLAEEADKLLRGLQLWAEANRPALTQDGRTKTVALPAGEICWRARPPSVRLRDAASVLAALGQRGLERFIRRKEEVDKDAMLREPAVAGSVPGVTIASAGEDFVVVPGQLPMSDGRAA